MDLVLCLVLLDQSLCCKETNVDYISYVPLFMSVNVSMSMFAHVCGKGKEIYTHFVLLLMRFNTN
jgi:hypothetical protein